MTFTEQTDGSSVAMAELTHESSICTLAGFIDDTSTPAGFAGGRVQASSGLSRRTGGLWTRKAENTPSVAFLAADFAVPMATDTGHVPLAFAGGAGGTVQAAKGARCHSEDPVMFIMVIAVGDGL